MIVTDNAMAVRTRECTDAQVTARIAPARAPLRGRVCAMSATVLVADDRADNRALAGATLEDEGYRVVFATNGEETVKAFARAHPECILLDVRMPGLDGPAACKRIRTMPGGTLVSIIFVTALHDLDTFDRAIEAGGDDFLNKPYRPQELVIRVEAALKVRSLAAERNDLYVEIKQQRDALQRLQLQKEQLISFLVHDLKNPVHAIDLQAQLLLRDRGAGERAHRAAVKIRDEGHSQLRMITTLLDIAKADEGQLAAVREQIDLSSLVAEVVETMNVHAAAANVALASDVATPTLRADPSLIRRVLENLVENAIRYSPEGSEVRVIAASVDGGIELRVSDAGPGVPPDQRARVFERFAQVDEQIPSRPNRGLGLAFCKLAVEAHGGRIWIEDASPGAVFCVRI